MAHYEVEKNRLYKDGERYNSGEGFHGMTDDEAQAETWFATFSHRYPSDGDHEWSVEVRKDGEVVKRTGPPRERCIRSMNRAYRDTPGVTCCLAATNPATR